MNFLLPEQVRSVFFPLLEKLESPSFLVGGFVRDTLLGRETKDLDIATARDPREVRALFPDGLSFPKFGTTTIKEAGLEITIASLRKEKGYLDSRHPTQVTFVQDYREDYPRRDFTINALYVGKELVVLDPSSLGLEDLKEKKIRFLGDPRVRIEEDPLRILRAYRFADSLGFAFEEKTKEAIETLFPTLLRLNPQKVEMELKKCSPSTRYRIEERIKKIGGGL